MDSLQTLTTFLGWCLVVNAAFLIFAGIFIFVGKEWIAKINAKIFGTTIEEAKSGLFQAFQNYRIAFAIFNIAPYIALRIMTGG